MKFKFSIISNLTKLRLIFNSYNTFLLIIFLSIFYVALYKIYMPRVNAFGCFDDCFNYVAAFFMLKGKILYSQIFFNHQMLPALISFLIQKFFNLINIYDLILRHRQFVFFFGFLFNVLIVARYKLHGLLFVLLYEFTKFYVFGDRFLAEAFIVYPLVYMSGIILYKLQNLKVYSFEYVLSGILVWFILFTREPYVPLVLLMFVIILWGKTYIKEKLLSFILFSFLTVLSLLLVSLKDFMFNVIILNTQRIDRIDILASFFYPLYFFFSNQQNHFRFFLEGLSAIFIFLSFLILHKKKIKFFLVLFIILGLANNRPVTPVGHLFYDSFHMAPWYGMFIFITLLVIKSISRSNKRFGKFLIIACTILFIYVILHPKSFIHDRVDPHYELITNYGPIIQIGEVVKVLSEPKDTLFLDGFDDLIYWQANRLSPYRYSWYTSFMPAVPLYVNERSNMFQITPPDFYYGKCPAKNGIPDSMLKLGKEYYTRLYSNNKPTCLFVSNSKINKISIDRWKQANNFLYDIPASIINKIE